MKKLDAFHLKTIAIVAMLINHIGHAFAYQWNPPVWQFFYLTIGMLTFPIMAYLLVEGFFYTKNRWRYMGRLAVFWILSILPFQLVFDMGLSWINLVNNIMFTLMMGLTLLLLCERISIKPLHYPLAFLFILLTIQSDWNIFGIPIIFAFYKTRGQQKGPAFSLLVTAFFMFLLTLPSQITLSASVFLQWLSRGGILLAVPILQHYNGQRGYSPDWVKWGFYVFYPLHLILLFLVRFLIFGY